MKILTRARDENDYSELLRLHVLVNDWNGNTDRPAISEQTLKTLTGLLRAKTQTLEFEGRNLVRNDFLMHRLRDIAYREEIDRAALTHAARVHANQVRTDVENEKKEFAELSADPRKFFLWLDRQKIEAPDEISLLDAILGRQF